MLGCCNTDTHTHTHTHTYSHSAWPSDNKAGKGGAVHLCDLHGVHESGLCASVEHVLVWFDAWRIEKWEQGGGNDGKRVQFGAVDNTVEQGDTNLQTHTLSVHQQYNVPPGQ